MISAVLSLFVVFVCEKFRTWSVFLRGILCYRIGVFSFPPVGEIGVCPSMLVEFFLFVLWYVARRGFSHSVVL